MNEMDRKIEQFLIWSLILKPKELTAVSEIVSERDFIDSFFGKAYRTMLAMKEVGMEIDSASLYIEMGRPNNISSVIPEDDEFLADPIHYATLLRKRNLENEIWIATQKREFGVAKDKIREIETIGAPINLMTIEAMIQGGQLSGETFKTGFYDLDKILRFRKKDLLVLAGKSGYGKSTVGLQILSYLAKFMPTGMISFEMSPEGISERMTMMFSLSYLSDINPNFFVTCPLKFNLMEVRKAIQQMQSRKVEVFLIDYLQLMHEPQRFASRHLEISHIARQIKELAKEFNAGIILISQISRLIEQRGKYARPVLSDLKESGDIEAAADSVLFVHRDDDKKECELILAKQRYGKKAIIQVIWLEDKAKYCSKEWRNQDDFGD